MFQKTKDRHEHFQLIFSYESILNISKTKTFYYKKSSFIVARVVFHSLNLKILTENDKL